MAEAGQATLGEAAGSLAGKRVIVTAAAQGIGRATAKAFLEAGARVEICDNEAAALEAFAAEAPAAGTTLTDVTDEAALSRFLDGALERLGGIDFMINNAGISGPTASIEEIELADWRRTLAVNLDATFLCCRRVAPLLKQAGQGAIVNLSSTAGLFGFGRRAPYSAAKWAIVGLTKTLAIELGPHGIRANAIAPGPVEGERIDRVIAGQAAARGASEAEVRESFTAGLSLRQFIRAEDIAAMITFLCSDAGARISGQVIAVDGHTEKLG